MEATYTMDDVLQEEESNMGVANAIFGEADANSCTYDMGYIRQVYPSFSIVIHRLCILV